MSIIFFFFKQKTAYEMRISDWSSDVCSSDLDDDRLTALDAVTFDGRTTWSPRRGTDVELALATRLRDATAPGESGWVEYDLTGTITHRLDRKSVVWERVCQYV